MLLKDAGLGILHCWLHGSIWFGSGVCLRSVDGSASVLKIFIQTPIPRITLPAHHDVTLLSSVVFNIAGLTGTVSILSWEEVYCAITALDGYPSHLDNIHYIRSATLIYALPPSMDHAITSILDTPYICLLLLADICLRPSQATRATSLAHF